MQVGKQCLLGGRQLISNVFAPYKCLVHVPWCAGDDARHCGVQHAQDRGSRIAKKYCHLCPGRDAEQA